MAAIKTQATTITINGQTIGGVVSFSGMDGEASDIDVTTLASTAKEYAQGIQDFGNFSMEIIRDPNDAGQSECFDQKGAQTTSSMVVTLPDTVTLNRATFNVHVKSMSMEGGVDAVATGSINCKISGGVTWSDSTP